MLLAARGMVDGKVCNHAVSAHQVGRLSMDVEDGQGLVALERVEAPAEKERGRGNGYGGKGNHSSCSTALLLHFSTSEFGLRERCFVYRIHLCSNSVIRMDLGTLGGTHLT